MPAKKPIHMLFADITNQNMARQHQSLNMRPPVPETLNQKADISVTSAFPLPFQSGH